jgi:hypothetical protein
VVVGEDWTLVVGEPRRTLEGHGGVDDYVVALDDADREDVEAVLDHAPSPDPTPTPGMGPGPMAAGGAEDDDAGMRVHVDLTPPELLRAALRRADPGDLDGETGVADVVDDLVGPDVDGSALFGLIEEWADEGRSARDLLDDDGPVDPALAAVFDADDAEPHPCVETGPVTEPDDLDPVVEAGRETDLSTRQVGAAPVRTENGVQPVPLHLGDVSVRAVVGAGEGPGRSSVSTPVVEVRPADGDPVLVQAGEGFDADEQREALAAMRERRPELPSYGTVVAEDGPLVEALDHAEHVDPAERTLTDDLAERSGVAGDETDGEGEDADDRSRSE